MPATANPFDLPARLERLTTPAAVCAELLRVTEPLGFPVYAIGGMPHPAQPYPTEFFFHNWPAAWGEAYFARRFGERDPTLRALSLTGRPFSIADLRAGKMGFTVSTSEMEMLEFATGLGLTQGFLVPVFRAHGYRGMACLAGPGPDPDPRRRALLQFVLEHSHDRLRKLGAAQAPAQGGPALSAREIEVLSLARHGMGDAGIAEAIRISVRTVRFHFENARHKLGARSRAEAIALAVSQHLLPE